jgi:hypothetical protein
MALQTFTDPEGVVWRVWKVDMPASRAHLMEANFRTGWLVFEREDELERRRLSQVPEDWSSLGPARLNQLREIAVVVTTPRMGTAQQSTVEIPRKRD